MSLAGMPARGSWPRCAAACGRARSSAGPGCRRTHGTCRTRCRAEHDRPVAGLGLWSLHLDSPLHDPPRPADPNRPCREVDVLPAQREQLPQPRASRHAQHDQVAQERAPLGRLQQRRRLLARQRHHLRLRDARQLDISSGVLGDEPPPPGRGGTRPLPLEVRLDAVAAVLLDGLSYRRAGRMVGISKTEDRGRRQPRPAAGAAGRARGPAGDPRPRQGRGLHQMPEHARRWSLASGLDHAGVAPGHDVGSSGHRTNGDESTDYPAHRSGRRGPAGRRPVALCPIPWSPGATPAELPHRQPAPRWAGSRQGGREGARRP
jgi:hypothetical protein